MIKIFFMNLAFFCGWFHIFANNLSSDLAMLQISLDGLYDNLMSINPECVYMKPAYGVDPFSILHKAVLARDVDAVKKILDTKEGRAMVNQALPGIYYTSLNSLVIPVNIAEYKFGIKMPETPDEKEIFNL